MEKINTNTINITEHGTNTLHWPDLVPYTESSFGGDWVNDIHDMHTKFGVRDKVETFEQESMRKFLEFRLNFLREELEETEKAAYEGDEVDCEEVVDGLIDLIVVAIGTLHAFGVDAHLAWDEVHKANMSKEVGIKEGRPNPLGLPDLCKPKGWQAPNHNGNHGDLPRLNNNGL